MIAAVRCRWAVVLVAAVCAQVTAESPAGRGVEEVAKNTKVNPPSLSERAPADRSLIATDEWLYVALKGNPNTLNPILMSSVPEERLKGLLYDYPFIYDENLQWKTNDVMVESYTESGDHLTTTLRLKKGLRWHDGQPFTAHDIVYSWQQITDDRVPAVSSRSGTDQISSCIALDEWTVRFVHQAALPTNKWNVMFGTIPKHIYEKGKAQDPSLATSEFYNRVNRHPVGNGPYRFVEWLTDDKIVLERWEDYPGPKPYFKRIVFRIIPDAHSRLLAFERQELDELELSPQQFARETDGQRFRQVGVKAHAPRWTFYYIGWNMDGSNPFFGDPRVRQAMCYATNYDLMIRQVFHGLFTQSYGLFSPGRATFHPGIKRFAFDAQRAAALLDEAGWTTDPQDGWRYKDVQRKGEMVRTKFAFTINVPKSETAPKVATILQSDLRKIGVEMKTHMLEWATFLQQCRNHEFEAMISAFTLGVDPDQAWNLFRSEAYDDARNYGGYANPRVDELFQLGRHCFDEGQRNQYYAELSKMIYEDAPFTFLANAPNLWAFNKRLRGVVFSPRGPHLFDPGVRDWWVRKGEYPHGSPK